jgi:hypothetical protein
MHKGGLDIVTHFENQNRSIITFNHLELTLEVTIMLFPIAYGLEFITLLNVIHVAWCLSEAALAIK